jgi:putative PIN family toxin of toxin-antitoxin system
VWVSAFLSRGPPSTIVKLAEEGRVEIVLSLDILDEINRVLHYDRLARILERAGTGSAEVMASILRLSTIIEVKTVLRAIREDPADNMVLSCAKQAKAQFLLSGDRHLLDLSKFDGVRIVTPAKFLESTALDLRGDFGRTKSRRPT